MSLLIIMILNKSGKHILKGLSPHQTSCQNFTLVPSPIWNWMWREKVDQPPLIVFHKLTPLEPGTELEHQSPSSAPYLALITLLHSASFSYPNLHNHFPNNASVKYLKFQIARPPDWIGEHTLDQFTKWCLEFPKPPPKKFHWSCSIQYAISPGIGKRELR